MVLLFMNVINSGMVELLPWCVCVAGYLIADSFENLDDFKMKYVICRELAILFSVIATTEEFASCEDHNNCYVTFIFVF